MSFGAGLAGLSAVYPGYMSAEEQQSKTEKNQSEAREAAMKLIGRQMYGNVLAGNNLSQGPQAPPPGQPSMPSAPPPQFSGPPPGTPQSGMGAAPMPSPQTGPPAGAPLPPPAPMRPLPPVAGGAPVAPPAGADVPQSGLPKDLDLHTLAQAVIQHNPPGVFKNNPELLFYALDAAKDHLTEQAKQDLQEQKNKYTEERLAHAKDLLAESIRQHDMMNDRGQRVADQRDIAEARRASRADDRKDKIYQDLQRQQTDLARKVSQGDRNVALKALHENTLAMHNKAMEIIQSTNQFNAMDPEDKKAFLDEQKKGYLDQKAKIDAIGAVTPSTAFTPRFDAARPSGVPSSQPPAEAPVAAPAAPAAPSVPPVSMLKPMDDYQKALAAGMARGWT